MESCVYYGKPDSLYGMEENNNDDLRQGGPWGGASQARGDVGTAHILSSTISIDRLP